MSRVLIQVGALSPLRYFLGEEVGFLFAWYIAVGRDAMYSHSVAHVLR